mgnify:CR=1 FL=1
MNIINIEHISKIFGGKVIFDDVSCGISEGEKIGVIGINGTGKTTLLRVLAGLEQPDEGQVITQNGIRIAYLQQNPAFPEEKTVLSYVTDGMWDMDWTLQSEAKSMLNQLGIVDHEQPLAELSGGQRRKAALVRTLVQDFDVLLLDEPTNHLDNEMLTWLEDYLNRYKGTVIMVTHDRYFLDRVSNRILELDHGKIYSYEANYSKFLELKVQREEMALATERKRQSVLRMELEWAKRGCRARSTKQRARLERLEALKAGKAPVSDATLEIEATAARMGRKTVELHHISKSYGEKKLVEDFDYIFLKNQKVGFIGPNGCGKSTLLKMIAGIVEPDSGTVEIGETVRIAYFAQELPELDTRQRVIDYVKDIGEYVQTRDGRITASQMLERFLFTPDMQYAPIEKLSGGEKKRLYLLGILQSNPNCLILDESNNDLDIPTLTILEDYLNAFSGIVITVSHDRYFLDNVADRIFEFSGDGTLTQYEGGYTDYLEAKQRMENSGSGTGGAGAAAAGSGTGGKSGKGKNSPGAQNGTSSPEEKDSRSTWKQNRPVKLKFTFKEQREFETIDDEIAAMEQKLEELDGEMMANATNSMKLSELTAEKEKTEKELEEKMDRWVYLNDLAEKIEAQKNA